MDASPRDDDSNPFEDPAGSEASMDASAVLTVDRNATLTLGTDALIVLDEGLRHKRAASNLCGFLPQLSKTTRAIPFHNILWAELNDFDVTVNFAQSRGRKSRSCRVGYIHYRVTEKSSLSHAKQWIERLMDRAYPARVMKKKRIKVLINPFGGQGNAQKIWTREVEPILAAARCEVDMERTQYRGHAIEIAQELDTDAWDVVACASGDGLPHEVFNGLAKHSSPRRALRKIAVCQIPCGSGNAMSLNLTGTASPSLAALEIVKAVRTPLDLHAITQGENRYYSFLSQAVGIIAETDLGTDSLRWMGPFRFTWGLLVRILGKTIYPAEVSVIVETDDKAAIKNTYRQLAEQRDSVEVDETIDQDDQDEQTQIPSLRFGTIRDQLHSSFVTQDIPNLGNFYVGNMCYMSPDAPFFVASLPSDGKMDMITIPGDISRLTVLKMLATIDKGNLISLPELRYAKILAYRIIPRAAPRETGQSLQARFTKWLGGAGNQKEGLIAIDGESIPFEPFQAEVFPRLATVLSKRGAIYETEGLEW